MRHCLAFLLVGCTSHEPKPVPKVEPTLVLSASSVSVPVEAPRPQNVLGKFQTLYDFKGKHEGRAKNIRFGASKLNGVVIAPGATLSFNETVGPRTLQNGFFLAKEIYLGEMVDGVGGGICQVSSTLFAAGLLADLDVVERRPHSRPLRYTQPGLDATVAFPDEATCKKDPAFCSDLKLRNPYSFPVQIVSAWVAEGDKEKVVFQVLGEGSPPSVHTRWWSNETTPFQKRMRKTGKFLGKYKKRVQSGREGLSGVLTVQGGRATRRIQSKYAPVDEIWEVGLGWDMSEMPWNTEP